MMKAVTDKQIQNRVIEELSEYRALRVKLNNLKRREENGLDNLFPVLIDSTKESENKVKEVEDALEALDFFEKKIVEMKYLSSEERNDEYIYLELGIRARKFYEKKRSAIRKIAIGLNII